MRKLFRTSCGFSVVVVLATSAAHRDHLRAQAPPAAAASGDDAAIRSRDLNRLFNDIWQDKLKHNPEYATTLGDKRYDTELSDLSPSAINDALAREQAFMQ